MDYSIWGMGTALIGVCCLLIGYLWGAHEPTHTRTGWETSPITETPPEQEDTRSQLERDLDDIISGSGMSDW